MDQNVFAEWLRRQGHHVVQTDSGYWFDQGPRVYQSFPYHHIIDPSEFELYDFLRKQKAIALRYSTSLNSTTGAISYHAIYDGATYGFENLERRSRQNVRKGLSHCTVEPISFRRLADEGWFLELDTLKRQGRHVNMSKRKWERRCLFAEELPGFEAWGAIVKGHLGASLMTFQMNDCCCMLYKQCHHDYLNVRINNALTFVVTQQMISRPSIRLVLYGLHSLDAPPSVDEFKFRMGYSAKPVRQRVVFNSCFPPLLAKATHAIVRGLLNRYPGNGALSKTEGLIRFYLEGRCPIEKQEWPEILAKQLSHYAVPVRGG